MPQTPLLSRFQQRATARRAWPPPLTHGRAARMHALMQTRIWNRNCEKRRFKALLESRLAFWLRRGLGSDIRACACNGTRPRSGLSLARRSLTQSDAVARRGRCRLSARRRHNARRAKVVVRTGWLPRFGLPKTTCARGAVVPGSSLDAGDADRRPNGLAKLGRVAPCGLYGRAQGCRPAGSRHAERDYCGQLISTSLT